MRYGGTPLGIDIRKVLRTGILPIINTGIAHKNPGVGQIGAGIIRLPLELFNKAQRALKGNIKSNFSDLISVDEDVTHPRRFKNDRFHY